MPLSPALQLQWETKLKSCKKWHFEKPPIQQMENMALFFPCTFYFPSKSITLCYYLLAAQGRFQLQPFHQLLHTANQRNRHTDNLDRAGPTCWTNLTARIQLMPLAGTGFEAYRFHRSRITFHTCYFHSGKTCDKMSFIICVRPFYTQLEKAPEIQPYWTSPLWGHFSRQQLEAEQKEGAF